MMLELHNVTIGELISSLSLTVNDGQLLTVVGSEGSGKTTLLRAILGFIPVDKGHISIDGELLTTRSAVWFRRQMAYVPQHLSLPEGYKGLGSWDAQTPDERYLQLLRKAVEAGKSLLLVDEPPQPLQAESESAVDELLLAAVQRGTTVLAINSRIQQNQVKL